MKIETKFDIGQEVYYIDIYKILKMKISEIAIRETDRLHFVNYILEDGKIFMEHQLFATRKEAEDMFI